MSDDVKPALAPDEWRERLEQLTAADAPIPYLAFALVTDFTEQSCDYKAGGRAEHMERHAIAALALHGQPFGFTREDVYILRGLSDDGYPETGRRLDALADRIAALLPPENADTPQA